jgi:peptide/nickel transport system permease protein
MSSTHIISPDGITVIPAPGTQPAQEKPEVSRQRAAWQRLRRNWAARIGGSVLLVLIAFAVLAPWLGTVDPTLFDAGSRDLLPGARGSILTLDGDTIDHAFLLGSDSLGRDIYSRIAYGARTSLIVGGACALLAMAFGTAIGVVAGYFRWADMVAMRIMDGIMAVPGVLIAISLVALWKGSLITVIIAVALPEIPRVARLVRSLVLSLREEPFIEAAISLGTRSFSIVTSHILPNSIAPLIVQGTYICASAMLTEAALSFLGVGLPPDIPTWGNIMAEGRAQFQQFPHNVLFAGAFLAISVLAVNMLGDGLRDTLDPKMAKLA